MAELGHSIITFPWKYKVQLNFYFVLQNKSIGMAEANHELEQNNATKLLQFNPMGSLAQGTYRLLQTVNLSLSESYICRVEVKL